MSFQYGPFSKNMLIFLFGGGGNHLSNKKHKTCNISVRVPSKKLNDTEEKKGLLSLGSTS